MRRVESDILIVGAGPAGLRAALAASESDAARGDRSRTRPSIVLVDENDQIGGQIWRRSAPAWANALIREAGRRGIEYLPSTSIIGGRRDGGSLEVSAVRRTGAGSGIDSRMVDRSETDDGSTLAITARSIILATGARELFLPFPGWTLPGVMGAGGAQAMVKSGMDVRGKRIVVAGSGPLLLAVASSLRKRGARIGAIVEQASASRINRFALGLAAHPGKLAQAVALKASLLGVRTMTSSWPIAAEGRGRVERVVVRSVSRGGGAREFTIACDLLACGFGLAPNTHLAATLGCATLAGFVRVDEFQRTSRDGVYCAGEPTGIGGVEVASIEGQIAGHAAAGDIDRARSLFPARARAASFADRLDAAFALRDDLRSIATDGTIVCRCEDVTLGRLRPHSTWRDAKLQTRCGMGACQGRVCGPITRYLLGFDACDARAPLSPVRTGALAEEIVGSG